MKVQIFISLDCAPGTPRPDTYYAMCLKCAGIAVDKVPEPRNKFFGCWDWDKTYEVPDGTDRKELISAIHTKQEELYSNGYIRYASIDVSVVEECTSGASSGDKTNEDGGQ